MLHVCLDTNWHAILHAAQADMLPLDDIVVFEDCLTFGDIADLAADARMAQLARWGISVDAVFCDHQQRFYEHVSQASSIRVWTGILPHQTIALSLVCALAQATASVLRIQNTVEAWLLDSRPLLERLDGFMRDASPVDREAQAEIWSRLVRENSDLRIVSGGIPCSADVDAFDGIIADELAREGWDGSEQRSYEVACACADEAGGLLAPEFFACRARRLSGRNGLACR